MPAPQRFIDATCPGVARPVRSPNPKLGAKPKATHFLVIDFLSDAADHLSVQRKDFEKVLSYLFDGLSTEQSDHFVFLCRRGNAKIKLLLQ